MKILFVAIFAFVVSATEAAWSCPAVHGVPDFNCDGSVRLVFLGDSLVSGFLSPVQGSRGGYVTRAAQSLAPVHLENLGEQGLMTGELLRELDRKLKPSSESSFKDTLSSADVIFLDLGRNDRWLFGEPQQAYRNLKKIGNLITSRIEDSGHVAPLVVTAVLMLPNRGSQGPWVKELNALIAKSSSVRRPADLRFDSVSKRLLSTDQVHPTVAGYEALAKVLVRYVTKTLPNHVRRIRTDADGDGIYDEFESGNFGCDPTLLDTDGDGVGDGVEVFSNGTDPLDPESY